MNALDRLLTLIPPPASVPGHDWARTETDLGTKLPDDFKQLVDAYGSTEWCGVIGLLYPTTDRPELDLAADTERQREYLSLDPETFASLFHGLGVTDASALIPWGYGDNGAYYLWDRSDDDPNRWPVILVDRDQTQTFRYSGSVTAFLCAWMTHELAAPELPVGFDRDTRLDGQTPSVTFHPEGAGDPVTVELPQLR